MHYFPLHTLPVHLKGVAGEISSRGCSWWMGFLDQAGSCCKPLEKGESDPEGFATRGDEDTHYIIYIYVTNSLHILHYQSGWRCHQTMSRNDVQHQSVRERTTCSAPQKGRLAVVRKQFSLFKDLKILHSSHSLAKTAKIVPAKTRAARTSPATKNVSAHQSVRLGQKKRRHN